MGGGVLFPGEFSRIYFKINKTMGWGYAYGKHIAHLNLWDSSLRTQKIKWRLYYCTWCKQIITWMERYPSIREPHHTTNLIEEIFLRGKSGGWLPLLGQGAAGELTEGGLHGVWGWGGDWSFPGWGVVGFQAQSLWILFWRVGQGLALGE